MEFGVCAFVGDVFPGPAQDAVRVERRCSGGVGIVPASGTNVAGYMEGGVGRRVGEVRSFGTRLTVAKTLTRSVRASAARRTVVFGVVKGGVRGRVGEVRSFGTQLTVARTLTRSVRASAARRTVTATCRAKTPPRARRTKG